MSARQDFWSLRKAAVQAETRAEQAAIEVQEEAARQAEIENRPDDEILAELNLPDPDLLQIGDDVSGFMAKAVPDRLRRRALRRLWRLNPVLANVDGLVDYGEDFTDASCVVENLQTAYQVGKGMLGHIEALAAEVEKTEQPVDADVEQDAETSEPEEADAPSLEVAAPAEPVEDEHSPIPRRMKFEFEG
ncbi:MAG: DUF3306 domain-containing protein [Ruegeria sp.]